MNFCSERSRGLERRYTFRASALCPSRGFISHVMKASRFTRFIRYVNFTYRIILRVYASRISFRRSDADVCA
jgi:hypothetical protein